jgi:hypothetical protein
LKKLRDSRRNKNKQQKPKGSNGQKPKGSNGQKPKGSNGQTKPKVPVADAFEQLRRSCKGILANGACPGTKQMGNPINVAGRQFVCCENPAGRVPPRPQPMPNKPAGIPCSTLGRNGVCRPVSGWVTKAARPRLGCPSGHYCSFGILSKKWGY